MFLNKKYNVKQLFVTSRFFSNDLNKISQINNLQKRLEYFETELNNNKINNIDKLFTKMHDNTIKLENIEIKINDLDLIVKKMNNIFDDKITKIEFYPNIGKYNIINKFIMPITSFMICGIISFYVVYNINYISNLLEH